MILCSDGNHARKTGFAFVVLTGSTSKKIHVSLNMIRSHILTQRSRFVEMPAAVVDPRRGHLVDLLLENVN